MEHPEQFIDFENRVLLEHTSFIDGYIPSTKVIDPLFLTALKKELADALAISGVFALSRYKNTEIDTI